MPTIKISLDPETYESLSAVAVRERRAISGQAFVLLRGSLGLPFPVDPKIEQTIAQLYRRPRDECSHSV
jgi:hypothetical protein